MNERMLPAIWEGTWQGDLLVVKSDDTIETVTMRLVIEPVSETAHTWRIEYLTDKQHSVRAYEIAPDESGSGRFVIDEKNGIRLDCRLFGNVLVSHFQVQGAMLHSRCEHRGDAIAVEIVSFDGENPRRNLSDEDNIEVLSYSCRAYQHGLLQRA